jgi:outer membrane protein insertion porin family
MPLFSRVLAALLVLICSAARAQYTVGSVAYKGGAPYTDAELAAVSGLEAGQMMATDALGTAAQQLLDTGLFDDVQATYTQQGKALHITFQIKPTPLAKLLPVSLENFVWFTPEELTAGLHQQLPLYRGVSSNAGSFSDSIQAALQQLLTNQGIHARLSHITIEPTNEHPQEVVAFRIESPAVRLAKIDLAGPIPEELQPALSKALSAAAGRPYNEGLSGVTLQDRILNPARNAGYVKASLNDLHRSVTSATGADVTVSATLDTGAAYKLSGITLTPGPLYSVADLARDTPIHPGDLAAANLLAKTEEPIQAAYRKQGYLDAYVTAAAAFDESAHTVAYTLQAVPGDIYHLKTLTITGLGPDAQKAFDAVWTLKEGDLYDATYIAAFVKKNIAQDVFKPYTFNYRAVGDPQTHLVDLTLTFVRNR